MPEYKTPVPMTLVPQYQRLVVDMRGLIEGSAARTRRPESGSTPSCGICASLLVSKHYRVDHRWHPCLSRTSPTSSTCSSSSAPSGIIAASQGADRSNRGCAQGPARRRSARARQAAQAPHTEHAGPRPRRGQGVIVVDRRLCPTRRANPLGPDRSGKNPCGDLPVT